MLISDGPVLWPLDRATMGLVWSEGAYPSRPPYRDYHRLLSRVFPYGIFYTFEQECAVVWAVVDLRRSPEWIRQRLTD